MMFRASGLSTKIQWRTSRIPERSQKRFAVIRTNVYQTENISEDIFCDNRMFWLLFSLKIKHFSPKYLMKIPVSPVCWPASPICVKTECSCSCFRGWVQLHRGQRFYTVFNDAALRSGASCTSSVYLRVINSEVRYPSLSREVSRVLPLTLLPQWWH